MTIKAKLIANVLLTAVIIVAISLVSFFSMRFLQEKLSYLTEKSTPFQMGTIELQRELQGCLSVLAKVNSAGNMAEYKRLKAEAETSLGQVEKARTSLAKLRSNTADPSGELEKIALELFTAVENRIVNNDAAAAANLKVQKSMEDSSARLNALDSSIRNLQASYGRSFTAAVENTGVYSGRLRNIEDLRNLVRELQLISTTIQNSQNATTVLIAKGKLKTVAGRIARNDYIRANPAIAAITNGFIEKFTEYVQHLSSAITQKDEGSRSKASDAGRELSYKLNDLFQTLDQESMLGRDELTFATEKQALIFSQSTISNSILVANSELITLGLLATGATNQLFTVDSISALHKRSAEIRDLFSRIESRKESLGKLLSTLNSSKELESLKSAAASLDAIKNEINSPRGIESTLATKLDAISKAERASEKLRDLVSQQVKRGKERVSAAHGEQEQSLAAVNSLVNHNISRIGAIAGVAIILAVIFGYWILRSVLRPLRVVLQAIASQEERAREKALLAEAVAAGDLEREVVVSEVLELSHNATNRDEMGIVLNALVGMSKAQASFDRAFAGMTDSLRSNRDRENRRDHLKNSWFELARILREEQETAEMADRSLAYIAGYLGAGVGIMYLYDEKSRMLQPLSRYAVSMTDRIGSGFALGEGLPGQAALERKIICLGDIPADYLPIVSSLGGADPRAVTLLPVMQNDDLVGVLELGSFRPFCDDDFTFLEQALESIAIAFKGNRSRQLVSELLEQTQQQTEELRLRQEELEQTNEELVERAHIQMELLKTTGN
jgi:putative methionine-R-sulfoxide reductase with GAF domain